jgi:hypothetical protein
MTSVACAIVLLLLAPQAIGEVESRVDKNANFSAYKTYAWRKGHEAFNPDAHKLIVSAIDAQMTGRGLTKVDDDDADVLVTYHSVRAADVDLKMFEQLQKEGKDTAPATKVLGKLAVAVSPRGSGNAVWTALGSRRLSDDPAKWGEDIRLTVAALFAKYPAGKK